MNERFEIDEIAQVRRDVTRVSPGMEIYLGERVVIEGALRFIPDHSRPMHVVRCLADGSTFYATAESLRKLPPPQDWVKLCGLRDIPEQREVEIA